jgi:hypothetical protein
VGDGTPFDWFEHLPRAAVDQIDVASSVFRALGATADKTMRSRIARRIRSRNLGARHVWAYRAALDVLETSVVRVHPPEVLVRSARAGECLALTTSCDYVDEWFGGIGPYNLFVIDEERRVYSRAVQQKGRSCFRIESELRARWRSTRLPPPAHLQLVKGIRWCITDRPDVERQFLERNGFVRGRISPKT